MIDESKKQQVKDKYQFLPQANAYGNVISEMAEKNDDIVVLTADLAGSTGVKVFSEKYPKRFFNFGIAETNMVAASAGFAIYGKIPYVSTFAAFASLRCAEAIRTDVDYPKLNVRFIVTHSGVSMGNGGTTHHATEDITILRSMANMTIIVPADSIETERSLWATETVEGPVYMRLGRGLDPLAYETDDYPFEIGKSVVMRDYGNDAAVIACGVCVNAAVQAADLLKNEGINITVINMHTIKPIDTEMVISAAKESGVVITAEEHTIIGGLGGAVAETLTDAGIAVKFKRLGLPNVYSDIGSPSDLRSRYKIDKDGIFKEVKILLDQVST